MCVAFVCIGVIFPVALTETVRLGHLVLLALIGIWMLGSTLGFGGKLRPRETAVLRFTAVLAICTIIAIATYGVPWRILDEGTKLVLILIGSVAITSIFGQKLSKLILIAYVALSINVIYVWRTTPELFTYGGRLQLEEWGSPNTLALLIALAVLTLVFSPHLPSGTRPLGLARWALLALLVFIDLQSTSRGGILALVVGLVAGSLLVRREVGGRGRRWGALAGILVVAVVALYVLSLTGYLDSLLPRFDLTAKDSSSGRTHVWGMLLEQWWSSDLAIVFGFGPGSVDIYLYGRFFNSAHSIVVSMLYWFGIVGLIAFIALWARTWIGALRATDEVASLRVALVAALSFSFSVDNSILASQAILPVALAWAATGNFGCRVNGRTGAGEDGKLA